MVPNCSLEPEAEGTLNAVGIESQQPCCSTGRTNNTNSAGRVPTLFVVGDIDTCANDQHGLQTGDVCIEHGNAAGPTFLAEC